MGVFYWARRLTHVQKCVKNTLFFTMEHVEQMEQVFQMFQFVPICSKVLKFVSLCSEHNRVLRVTRKENTVYTDVLRW